MLQVAPAALAVYRPHDGLMASPRALLCRYGHGNASRPSVGGAFLCSPPRFRQR
jgi:hypothetical protein